MAFSSTSPTVENPMTQTVHTHGNFSASHPVQGQDSQVHKTETSSKSMHNVVLTDLGKLRTF